MTLVVAAVLYSPYFELSNWDRLGVLEKTTRGLAGSDGVTTPDEDGLDRRSGGVAERALQALRTPHVGLR